MNEAPVNPIALKESFATELLPIYERQLQVIEENLRIFESLKKEKLEEIARIKGNSKGAGKTAAIAPESATGKKRRIRLTREAYEKRREQIRSLYLEQGVAPREICAKLGLSRKTLATEITIIRKEAGLRGDELPSEKPAAKARKTKPAVVAKRAAVKRRKRRRARAAA
jgi:hypothetical protein